MSVIKGLVLKTSNPTVNDDSSKGFYVGFEWVNGSTTFKCYDSTVGSAVWFIQINSNSTKYEFTEGKLSRTGQTTIPLINQQLLTLEKYIGGNFTPTKTDNYVIGISFIWSMNNANNNFLGILRLNDGLTDIDIPIIIEAKDVGGAGEVANVLQGGIIIGNVNTGTSIRHYQSFLFNTELIAATSYTYSLLWGSSSINKEATIYQAQIWLEQKTINI